MSVKSKSNAVHKANDPLLPRATVERITTHRAKRAADATLPLLATTQGQRAEEMYQLANIFAAIFEALPEEYEHAIATKLKAA
jgi:hypothetical protein